MPCTFHLTRKFVLLGVGVSALTGGAFSSISSQQSKVKLPPLVDSPQVVALGRALFHDKTLSDPEGMACVSCHDPKAGYSYPSSFVNAYFGTVPGAVRNRFGNRRPPSLAYAPFMKKGVPHYDQVAIAWVGGLFWDGRVADAHEQVQFPLTNPNEMNNTVHGLGSAAKVVDKIRNGSSSAAFKRAFGAKVFTKSPAEVMKLVAKAIVAYESSREVSPFTSKYDAYLEGKAELTPQETLGMRLATGRLNGRPDGLPFRKSAHCTDCHALSDDLSKGPDLWTNSCYANLGVPRNNSNLYFYSNDKKGNPTGYNADGQSYIDLGLAGFIYSYYGWTPRTPHGKDPLRLIGTFKAPTLRNVDMRPYPGFVKAYMHNGVFKSLKEVVHFYNTRNLTSEPGEVINYTEADPYANLKGKPLWPKPEYLNADTLINPTGMSSGFGSRGTTGPNMSGIPDLDAMQIGNLILSESQEDAIVAFLKCLTDGYFKR